MKIFFLCLVTILFSPIAQADIVTETVEYRDGETVLEGYLAYDNASEDKRPAILVVHEWKGLNDYARKRAEQLAKLGYVGFAIDMYGKGVRPESHEEAGKISGAFRRDRNRMRLRAKAALDFLKSRELVDPKKIAAMGYCFGGMAVLEMARAGIDLKGVASFHGALQTPVPAEPGAVRAKVIVFHGEEDPFVKAAEVEAFKEEMRNAGADWQLKTFSGAVHSFTVPEAGNDKNQGVAYNAAADKESWSMLEDFLHEIFAD